VPATAFVPSNGVCTGPTPPLVGVPREGRGPSTGTQQADNRGARVHTPRVPATKQRPSALGVTGALRRPCVGAGSNIKTTTSPPQAGRPVKSDNNRNVAPPGPPPAARKPANQTPRALPPHRRGPSLATAKGPHYAVREVDAMADSGTNRTFTLLNSIWRLNSLPSAHMIYANFGFVSHKSLVSVFVITRMQCTLRVGISSPG